MRSAMIAVASSALLFAAACATQGATLAAKPDIDPYLPINRMLVANACSNCHAADYTRVGPPMNAIALAYEGADAAELARLKSAIVSGTKGRWGAAAMPAQIQVTPAKADEILAVIRKYGGKAP